MTPRTFLVTTLVDPTTPPEMIASEIQAELIDSGFDPTATTVRPWSEHDEASSPTIAPSLTPFPAL